MKTVKILKSQRTRLYLILAVARLNGAIGEAQQRTKERRIEMAYRNTLNQMFK